MRAEAFCTTVFGWTVRAFEHCTRWGVGGLEFGGMITMDAEFPPEVPPHWLPYFVVADVDAAAATARRAGGTVLMEPASLPDGPRIAVLGDPRNAVFGGYRAADEA